ncbi:MAG: hypothetical protein R3325_05990 [Thermoanaerobaculia bacterium]|nr:hypothetical protein [Thermoanaerobaculia bacterium]
MSRARIGWTAAAIAALVVAAPAAQAKKLDDAAIYIEINATDGDAGIQVFLDGEGWDTMTMTGPNGTEFSVLAESGVGMQGITEFFFESAEPSFEEQSLEELLALFPRGRYTFEGRTTEGKRLRGKAKLTHRLPEAPVQISPVDGEEVDPDDAVFSWQAVADPPGSEIVGYEVVIECEEPDFVKVVIQVGADVTSVTAPPEVLGQEDLDECKWEVLAIEDSGNQTISETVFSLE